MRLIDADALKYSRVQIFYGLRDNGEPLVGGMNAVVMSCAIKDAPTIDAVEVVRCKDCKHLYQDTFDDSLWCCRDVDREVVENHFCSYGERRDSNG